MRGEGFSECVRCGGGVALTGLAGWGGWGSGGCGCEKAGFFFGRELLEYFLEGGLLAFSEVVEAGVVFWVLYVAG